MPEGPEVYNYYNYIKLYFEGQVFHNIEVLSGRYTKKPIQNLEYLKKNSESSVSVKGKTLYISAGEYALVITHGMTAYWSTERSKYSRVLIETSYGRLYYDDIRGFGTIRVTNDLKGAMSEQGPDVLDDNIDINKFYDRLNTKKRKKIGAALLEQKLVSGIGNYLRCDILWHAGIDGETMVKDLSTSQKDALYKSAIDICRYYAGKSTKLIRTPEDYDKDFYVYMEDTDPYGNKVYKKKLGSRTLHYTLTQGINVKNE